MENEKRCSSCNKEVANLKGVVNFKCPSCGDSEITRCPHCRKIVTKYTCKKCGFEGP